MHWSSHRLTRIDTHPQPFYATCGYDFWKPMALTKPTTRAAGDSNKSYPTTKKIPMAVRFASVCIKRVAKALRTLLQVHALRSTAHRILNISPGALVFSKMYSWNTFVETIVLFMCVHTHQQGRRVRPQRCSRDHLTKKLCGWVIFDVELFSQDICLYPAGASGGSSIEDVVPVVHQTCSLYDSSLSCCKASVGLIHLCH